MKRDSSGHFYGKFSHPTLGKITLCKDGTIRSSVRNPAERKPLTLDQYARLARVRHASALWHVIKTCDIKDFFTCPNPYARIIGDASLSHCLYGLSNSQKNDGTNYVAPILVSWGDILPVQYDNGLRATDISLGLNRLRPDTPFNDFVRWILDENPTFLEDDFLALLYLSQKWYNGKPCVDAIRAEVHLVPTPGTITEVAPQFFELVKDVPVGLENALTVDHSSTACAFAFIHSGWRGKVMQSSTQHLICRYDCWPEQIGILRKEFHSLNGTSDDGSIVLKPKSPVLFGVDTNSNPLNPNEIK